MSIELRRVRKCWKRAVCGLALFVTGCLEPKASQPVSERTCTACHGDERRSGEALNRAAPPADLDGNDDPRTIGVGAHERHLSRKSHAPVACQACHMVPESVFDPGHVDTGFPAEVTFAGLAVSGARQPSYDRERGACTNTYCHANASVDWTAARPEKETCGTCHGSPPALPHPQKTECAECHGEVIGRNGQWVLPERHVDGKVDVSTAAKCATCHGQDPATGAPPPDLAGQVTSAARAVGAHSNHLNESATHGPMQCGECHQVPIDVESLGHLDGDGRAEVVFGMLAKSQRRRPSYDVESLKCSDTYCHGATTGDWNAPRDPRAACGSCHGLPPPPPHSQVTQCANCHARVVSVDGTIKEPGLHVNGNVEVDFASDCNNCHGSSESAAPPRDLRGNVQSSARGVGAHAEHVVEGSTHAAVACQECHVVPATVTASGHLDGDGISEISFGPLSTAMAHRPSYDPNAVGCSDTYCHRDAQPNWLAPRNSEAACGSCHALPPPSPHPAGAEDCSTCHAGIDPSRRFVSPELHVNGRVDLLEMPCNGCHGNAANGAPPADTMGNRSPSARGVGSHDLHLQASASHGPVACNECHIVPAQTDSVGHNDSGLPAEINFGRIATADGHSPRYSPTLLTCAGSYCHGEATPNWIQPLGAAESCGSCHGVPPTGLHPQRSDCGTCHSAVMDLAGNFIAPERHVDGTLDLGPLQCNTCHGTTVDGAPPRDVAGGDATSLRGVGAHAAHLQASATHGPVACSECHRVPTAWDLPGHVDTALPAEIVFGGLAVSSGASPQYLGETASCAGTYCHAGYTPVWTNPRSSEQACGSCHALPPAFPHPQNNDCSLCHGVVIDAQMRFLMPDLHVDGRVQVEQTCTACHGTTNAAPPTDLAGGSEPTRLGVGAHQTHLSGGNFSRPLACGECHLVPTTITSPGHLDPLAADPAEVVLTGPAAAANRNPRWDRTAATCSGSYCHGPSDALNASPSWVTTVVDLPCTSCHGWPPAPPHSADTRCWRCHSNIDAQGDILDRSLHVNGEIDL